MHAHAPAHVMRVERFLDAHGETKPQGEVDLGGQVLRTKSGTCRGRASFVD